MSTDINLSRPGFKLIMETHFAYAQALSKHIENQEQVITVLLEKLDKAKAEAK